MKFQSLDGRTVRLQLEASSYPIKNFEQSPSKGQYNLGQRIQEIYNGSVILEEFGIPGTRLSLDFFVPDRRIAFEFQGVQHDKFNPFFHASKIDLDKQNKRDQDKREWCKLNSITLIEVRNQYITTEELKELITNA